MSDKIPDPIDLEEILSEIKEPVKKLEQNKSMFATDICPTLRRYLKKKKKYNSKEDAEIRILPTGIVCDKIKNYSDGIACKLTYEKCPYQKLADKIYK